VSNKLLSVILKKLLLFTALEDYSIQMENSSGTSMQRSGRKWKRKIILDNKASVLCIWTVNYTHAANSFMLYPSVELTLFMKKYV